LVQSIRKECPIRMPPAVAPLRDKAPRSGAIF
jgi:hypothetical protein